MTLHLHIEVPRPITPSDKTLPATCLALAALAGIAYLAFVYHPVTSFELPKLVQGSVFITPFIDPTKP